MHVKCDSPLVLVPGGLFEVVGSELSPAYVSEILGSLSMQCSEDCEVLGGCGSVIACLRRHLCLSKLFGGGGGGGGLSSGKELRMRSTKSILEGQSNPLRSQLLSILRIRVTVWMSTYFTRRAKKHSTLYISTPVLKICSTIVSKISQTQTVVKKVCCKMSGLWSQWPYHLEHLFSPSEQSTLGNCISLLQVSLGKIMQLLWIYRLMSV